MSQIYYVLAYEEQSTGRHATLPRHINLTLKCQPLLLLLNTTCVVDKQQIPGTNFYDFGLTKDQIHELLHPKQASFSLTYQGTYEIR